jgi:LMBR1 domain-containing protein 1
MQHQECAVVAAAGWILFLVFAGWGMFAAPIDWIFQYIRRPKSVITKSEYIDRARGLAQRAKEVKVRGTAAQHEIQSVLQQVCWA